MPGVVINRNKNLYDTYLGEYNSLAAVISDNVKPKDGSYAYSNDRKFRFYAIDEIWYQESLSKNLNKQRSFFEELSSKISYDAMYIRRHSTLGWLNILYKKGNKHLTWLFRNNSANNPGQRDDYWILGDCYIGDVTEDLRPFKNIDYDINNFTGDWFTGNPNAHYAITVGSTLTVTLTTSRLLLHHFADDRGGLLKIVKDGDDANAVTISTYNAVVLPPNAATIFDDLVYEPHTFVITFIGDDPDNPPSNGAGNSRGYIWFGTNENTKTFRTFKPDLFTTREIDLAQGFSNKEYAIQCRLKGDLGAYQYLPMHSGVGTVFEDNPIEINVDGKVIDIFDDQFTTFQKCNNITITQDCTGINTNTAEGLLKIDTVHSFDLKARVSVHGSFTALEALDVNIGYGGMLPVHQQSFDKLITSLNTDYKALLTDGSRTNLVNELDTTESFLFVNTENPNYFISIDFFNPVKTLRQDSIDKGAVGQTAFLEHRDANVAKLYNKLYQGAEIKKGEVLKISLGFYAGEIKNIAKTL